MQYVDLISMAVVAGAIALDRVRRGRGRAADTFWGVRATLVSLLSFYLAGYVSLLWSRLLGDYHLLDGAAVGTGGGAAAGVLLYEVGHYAYHRAAHSWRWLWRAGHQLHHSAERLDTAGAFFLHPVDVAALTSLRSLVFFPLLGLSAQAGIAAALFLTGAGLFQHLRMRTPRWLGYLVQRPESHSVHHARGVHAYNYATLPLLDLLFGTFINPQCFIDEQGFHSRGSARIGEMLLMRDIRGAA